MVPAAGGRPVVRSSSFALSARALSRGCRRPRTGFVLEYSRRDSLARWTRSLLFRPVFRRRHGAPKASIPTKTPENSCRPHPGSAAISRGNGKFAAADCTDIRRGRSECPPLVYPSCSRSFSLRTTEQSIKRTPL